MHTAMTAGNDWPKLKAQAHSAVQQRRGGASNSHYAHPLKQPLRNSKTGVPICRFHNYSMVRGCKLFKDDKNLGTNCPNDHTHCHWCREEGHIALRCPKAGGYRFEPEKEITSCLFIPPPALCLQTDNFQVDVNKKQL